MRTSVLNLALAALTALGVSKPATAQFNRSDLEVLYELEIVRVEVQAPLAGRVRLNPEEMATSIRQRLERAQIPVAQPDFGPRLAEIPALTVRIHAISVAALVAGVYAYVVELELQEPTELFRNSAVAMRATTWRALPRQGAIADGLPDELLFDVDRMVDDFINAYVTANADLRRWR